MRIKSWIETLEYGVYSFVHRSLEIAQIRFIAILKYCIAP
jgi:hypothetical protein